MKMTLTQFFAMGIIQKMEKIRVLHKKEKAIKLNGVINKKVEKIFHSSLDIQFHFRHVC